MERIWQYQSHVEPLGSMATPAAVSLAWVFVQPSRVVPKPRLNETQYSVEPIFVPTPYDPATLPWNFYQAQRVLPRPFFQPAATGNTIVVIPTSSIVGFPEIEYVTNLIPRATPKPNMPIAYITQWYRYSTDPSDGSTQQSPGTQPQYGP